jgi:fluoride exporter
VRLVLGVAIGGALGSVLRFWLGGLAQGTGRVFPWGTLAVNVAGCFVIGAVSHLVEARGAAGPATRAFLLVGLLGGFTTFSAFGNETLNLVRDGERLLAAGNVVANVGLGLLAVWAGRAAAHAVWG